MVIGEVFPLVESKAEFHWSYVRSLEYELKLGSNLAFFLLFCSYFVEVDNIKGTFGVTAFRKTYGAVITFFNNDHFNKSN